MEDEGADMEDEGADVVEFERLRALDDGQLQKTDWSGADLARANMSGLKFYGAKLRGANLSFADLRGADTVFADADCCRANLENANLTDINLVRADLSGASLRGATLQGACLMGANLSRADLRGANLRYASLNGANLSGANATGANFSETNLTGADLSDADLTGARVFGMSAWKLKLGATIQNDLIISDGAEPILTVDHIEVAQFIYLLLHNEKIRDVINTISSKAVLILGRFADPSRKAVLDGLRERLRHFDLLPMVFDFDGPTDRDYTETVQTLAGMCMFVIADLTSPKSTPLELEATVKQFKVPYLPIIDTSVDPRPFSMLTDLQKSFHWVLPTLGYDSKEALLVDETLKEYIIDRAMSKREELRKAKHDEPEMLMIPTRNAGSTSLAAPSADRAT